MADNRPQPVLLRIVDMMKGLPPPTALPTHQDYAGQALLKAEGRKEAWAEARGVLLGEISRLRKQQATKGPDPKRYAVINRLTALAKHFRDRT